MPSFILSIDPSGDLRGHTGIVLLQFTGHDPPTRVASWAIAGGVEAFREWYDHEWSSFEDTTLGPLGCGVDLTVVVERFMDRQVMGADRSPMLVEGAVRFLWNDAVLSPASGYKTAVPDHVLKRLGLWWTQDHHGDRNSAARHAIRYLKNQGHTPTLRAGWPSERNVT